MSSSQLLVVDILRSSVNDGPGIRTTVFVKGCPLRCAWCHNPESQSPRPEIALDASRCTGCGKCVEVCPNEVHTVADGKHTLARDRCQFCGECSQACPAGVLKLIGKPWTPQAVVDLALRDKAFYDRSGGGLTISGGEPMAQFDAVLETLKLAKAAGLHVCLDTCGQAPTERYLQILPFVDLFLWDYKATGVALHRDLTGVDGDLIGRNLRALYAAGTKIRLRCPMVPGLNDSAEHLKAIAELSAAMPNLDGIDIMPYHSFGRDKATRVGMSQADLPERPATEEQIDIWLTRLQSFGCHRATLG